MLDKLVSLLHIYKANVQRGDGYGSSLLLATPRDAAPVWSRRGRGRESAQGGSAAWHPADADLDAIVETPEETIPLEVKWTDSPSPRDARHIETFLDLHRALAQRGYVVCRCPRRQQLTERVVAVGWEEF